MESVVFDFDGVIIDSPQYYMKYMRNYLLDLSTDITEEDMVHLVGYPFQQKINYINKTYGLNIEKQDFVDKTFGDMNKEMYEKIKCPNNLKNMLEELKQKGIELNIASSNSEKNVLHYLEKFEIKDYFAHIITLDNVEKPKPFPDTYLEVTKRIKKNPVKCVAIEDTVIGVESATLADFKCIAIPNKFTLNHDFSKADLIVKSFEELTVKKLEGLV